MNERIRELWEEATVSTWPRPGKFTAGEYDYHLEKFAELIVRECMAQCVKVEDDDELSNYEGGFRDGALLCYQEIREHFGVEE
jgi:hypothetical protein